MQKIVPFLWLMAGRRGMNFFYISIFRFQGRECQPLRDAGPGQGTVMRPPSSSKGRTSTP